MTKRLTVIIRLAVADPFQRVHPSKIRLSGFLPLAYVKVQRIAGSLIHIRDFAIPFSRKWFLINRTVLINTTVGSVNQPNNTKRSLSSHDVRECRASIVGCPDNERSGGT